MQEQVIALCTTAHAGRGTRYIFVPEEAATPAIRRSLRFSRRSDVPEHGRATFYMADATKVGVLPTGGRSSWLAKYGPEAAAADAGGHVWLNVEITP